MTWKNQFSVGVKTIDQQHKKIILYIDELNRAMKKGKSRVILRDIFLKLDNYIIDHFATEEKYFDKFNFPGTLAHKREHKEFSQRISTLKQDFGEGKLLVSMELMDFLTEWWTNHIMGDDKEYARCFNEHGLS